MLKPALPSETAYQETWPYSTPSNSYITVKARLFLTQRHSALTRSRLDLWHELTGDPKKHLGRHRNGIKIPEPFAGRMTSAHLMQHISRSRELGTAAGLPCVCSSSGRHSCNLFHPLTQPQWRGWRPSWDAFRPPEGRRMWYPGGPLPAWVTPHPALFASPAGWV